MTTYHYSTNVQLKQQRWRRLYHAVVVGAVLLIVGAIGVGWYLWQRTDDSQIANQATVPVHETYNPNPPQVYENQSFRFSSDRPWILSKTDSTPPTKYTYYSLRSGLVERQFTTYIGSGPSDLAVTYILPVTSRGDSLAPGTLSPRCGEGLKLTNMNPLTRTYQDVTYTCIPDSKAITIAAGMPKGSYGIPLKGSDGESRTLIFTYKDVSINPQPDIFADVLKTLRLK